MDIWKATKQYERWLAGHTVLVKPDIDLKHREMAAAPFPFFRATYYRWAQVWTAHCKHAVQAPVVLSVGDLHVENFGTWRDGDGRLAWGVNDFDEVARLPYTNDLIRLASSALISIGDGPTKMTAKEACDAIVGGYTESMSTGGRPYVLAERNQWLRELATGSARDPAPFWKKMDALAGAGTDVPESARVALEMALPQPGLDYTVKRRVAGLGSLGHQRYVALAQWDGGRIAREAKAMVPSAVSWEARKAGVAEILYEAAVTRAVRSRDSYVHLQGTWIVRRLAPDCSRVELSALPRQRLETELLHAMGWETANIHLGTRKAAGSVTKDLNKRSSGWLLEAAKIMVDAVTADWQVWKSG